MNIPFCGKDIEKCLSLLKLNKKILVESQKVDHGEIYCKRVVKYVWFGFVSFQWQRKKEETYYLKNLEIGGKF